jgi:hypothetical protein
VAGESMVRGVDILKKFQKSCVSNSDVISLNVVERQDLLPWSKQTLNKRQFDK